LRWLELLLLGLDLLVLQLDVLLGRVDPLLVGHDRPRRAPHLHLGVELRVLVTDRGLLLVETRGDVL